MKAKPTPVGQRFGMLVVIGEAEGFPKKRAVHVVCDCGRTARVRTAALWSGNTKSCGCRHRSQGGLSKQPGYHIYESMLRRCFKVRNRAYPSYGGRGITVCERWLGPGGFTRFLSDMGPRPSVCHSIDRIDNDGDYEPGNVRWATAAGQGQNKRNNRLITFAGTFTDTLSGWSRVVNIAAPTIHDRLRKGWSPEDALMVRPGEKRL